MWFSFWRSRDRFSLDELRYLTEQLQKVQIVNEVNKDFVVEALRSIAELVTYGDQHDPSFFEYFMERQIMGEFVRILRISRPAKVALQLLQTMSIMIQNLKSEHAIYYIFSNEHINYLITYSFDFGNEELLSYYISFLRAISGKLNRNTISLLVKTENDEIVSFPLYTEAVRFAFHDESMVRTAVRALTLNVYHVGDECVNRYLSRYPLSDYFSNLVKYFRKQCTDLDRWVSQAAMNPDSSGSTCILSAVDEIEDNLYYFSDIISAGVPDLGRLITDNFLRLLVFPLLLPSLGKQSAGAQIGVVTSLYLLCCILHIVKTKDLASTIGAALFYPPEMFIQSESRTNGCINEHHVSLECQEQGVSLSLQVDAESVPVCEPNSSDSPRHHVSINSSPLSNSCASPGTLREVLLSYIISGDDIQVVGSLSLLATLLQTKELDESLLDGFGILPQRKQHKKLLLQALVGEGCGEEQLFSSESSMTKDDISTELDRYLKNLQDEYGIFCCCGELGINPRLHRYQVLDALVSLFCRSGMPAETLWAGGWLLRQLLPLGEEEFTSHHLNQLKDSHKRSITSLREAMKGIWSDLLIAVLKDEWRNCKRAIEGPSTPNDPKTMLLPSRTCPSGGESSCATGESMCEMVKVFVLQRQLLTFSSGGSLLDQPPVQSPINSPVHTQAKPSGLDASVPKLGSEIILGDALPCRIAFERGKERHFSFIAISKGVSGWLLLAEELQLKQQYGVVRLIAPLCGSNPRIDDKHPRWLHLRIRPFTLPSLDPRYDSFSKGKAKVLVDGRWTLAFRDEQACKLAESMITKEIHIQQSEVEKRIKSLLNLNILGHAPGSSNTILEAPEVEPSSDP